MMLSEEAIQGFVRRGFLRLEGAIPAEVAADCRALLGHDIGPPDAGSGRWSQPVLRPAPQAAPPFRAALASQALHRAFDRLVGQESWLPPQTLSSIVVRLPSPDPPRDDGWHVDMSFGWEQPDFLDWRANIHSRGRCLVLLVLLSDVGEADAPTRLRVGSHGDVARLLAPAGEAGLSLREILARLTERSDREIVEATGPAGTVYLCHPFLVHAAQPHRGRAPRFLAQPPLLPRREPWMAEGAAVGSPVAVAIRAALAG